MSAVVECIQFVKSTWTDTVLGKIDLPGVPDMEKHNVTMRMQYADSIVMGDRLLAPGNFKAVVLTHFKKAVDLEYGQGPWDMKDMLLNGPKAKRTEKGTRYNVIPFRHGVPGGTQNSFFKNMPKDVYQMAKALKPSITSYSKPSYNTSGRLTGYSRTVKWGERLGGTTANHPARVHEITHNPRSGAELSPKIRYEHKSGIYEGMTKLSHDYEKTTQSKYMTFRVVSDNSDPHSWWHPGYEPHHILKGVEAYCNPEIEQKLDEAAKADLVVIMETNLGRTG